MLSVANPIALLLLVLVLLFLFFLVAFRPLRIVRDYERLVVFRLGRFVGRAGPGPGVAVAHH